jgi:hypothetical protein
MGGLFGWLPRSRADGECATHGSYPGELDGCLKCGAGSVAQSVDPSTAGPATRSAAAAAAWLERQAVVLEMAARLDPAAANAARMAAQARALAALTERSRPTDVRTDVPTEVHAEVLADAEVGAVFEPAWPARHRDDAIGDDGSDAGSDDGWEAGW